MKLFKAKLGELLFYGGTAKPKKKKKYGDENDADATSNDHRQYWRVGEQHDRWCQRVGGCKCTMRMCVCGCAKSVQSIRIQVPWTGHLAYRCSPGTLAGASTNQKQIIRRRKKEEEKIHQHQPEFNVSGGLRRVDEKRLKFRMSQITTRVERLGGMRTKPIFVWH